MAAERGVRVFTVGFGTVEGGTIGFEGWSVYVRLDEETLRAIADVTRGEYFHAGTAADLKKVYDSLNSRLVLERKETEVTFIFAAFAAAAARRIALLADVVQPERLDPRAICRGASSAPALKTSAAKATPGTRMSWTGSGRLVDPCLASLELGHRSLAHTNSRLYSPRGQVVRQWVFAFWQAARLPADASALLVAFPPAGSDAFRTRRNVPWELVFRSAYLMV